MGKSKGIKQLLTRKDKENRRSSEDDRGKGSGESELHGVG